jgi:hypothetical protein
MEMPSSDNRPTINWSGYAAAPVETGFKSCI